VDENGICKDFNPDPDNFNPGHQLFNFFTGKAYSNNQLTDFSPFSATQNILKLIPEPNQGTNIFNFTETARQDSSQFGIRLDHYLSPKDSLNFRYLFSDGNNFDPLSTSGASIPGFAVGEDHRAQNFV